MSFPTETVLAFLGGRGFFWLLLAGFVLSLGLGRYAWHQGHTSSTRDIWLGAAAMLACFLAWAVFSVLFHVGKLPPQLWMAPFDRLFVIACLVALGWALTSSLQGAAQWRRFLIAGLFATVLAYAAWAPLWAREFHSRPWLMGDPTGLTRVWDAWQVVLGLAVAVAVLRRTRRAPGWVLGALVGLIAASVLELFVPLSPVFPAWSRLGTLVAGTFFVGAAVTQVVDFPYQRTAVRMPVGLRVPSWRSITALVSRPFTPSDQQAGREASQHAAAPDTGDLSRALTALESQATTLTHISQSVESLNTRVGNLEASVGGDVAPNGSAPANGAASSRVPVAAVALAEPEVQQLLHNRAPGYERTIECLPWGVLVADADGAIVLANPAAERLLGATGLGSGTTLESVFPDADKIRGALKRSRDRSNGGHDRVAEAIEVSFDTPALQAELTPLSDPEAGYLGTVAVLQPRTQAGPDVDEALVGSLTEALRAPMTMILGYSDLLTRGSGLTDEQLERFLQRIDANLARMQVMLGNLVSVVQPDQLPATLGSTTTEPVDLHHAIETAVRRARPQLAEKGLAVNVVAEDELELLAGDGQTVRRILDNLLVNACQRSPQGGDITVDASVRQDQRGRRAMVVSVHDRGKQLSGATGLVEIDDGPSTPAALKVVRMLADALGGGSWAETDQLGAQFYVRLPVDDRV